MISVQILLVSSLLLTAFFSTSLCVLEEHDIEEGDIALYFDFNQDNQGRANCVLRKGDNLKLGVGELFDTMKKDHPDYEIYRDKANQDGTFDDTYSEEISQILHRNFIDAQVNEVLSPLLINIIKI